jgi:hypothetical protein
MYTCAVSVGTGKMDASDYCKCTGRVHIYLHKCSLICAYLHTCSLIRLDHLRITCLARNSDGHLEDSEKLIEATAF